MQPPGAALDPSLKAHILSFIASDAASFCAGFLFCTAFYSAVYGGHSHNINILELKGMTISAINEALPDAARGLSDQVIFAVAEMAAYEAFFGDVSVSATHLNGLTRMVRLRGGLSSLGVNGILERMLLSLDANVAYFTRTSHRFDDSFSPSMPHPPPNLRLLSHVRQHQDVTR